MAQVVGGFLELSYVLFECSFQVEMGNSWFSSEKMSRITYSVGEKAEFRDERVWRLCTITKVNYKSLSYGILDARGKEIPTVLRENLRPLKSAPLEGKD